MPLVFNECATRNERSRLRGLKVNAPAVRREAEEDWGKETGGDDRHEQDHDLRPEGRRNLCRRISAGDVLAISIPRTETAVIRHFQERMPYGLFVPDVP
jgi:hypothetical protein